MTSNSCPNSEIYDDGYRHALRIYRDHHSKAVRLQASVATGSMKKSAFPFLMFDPPLTLPVARPCGLRSSLTTCSHEAGFASYGGDMCACVRCIDMSFPIDIRLSCLRRANQCLSLLRRVVCISHCHWAVSGSLT
jgi:hypothetical protein